MECQNCRIDILNCVLPKRRRNKIDNSSIVTRNLESFGGDNIPIKYTLINFIKICTNQAH